MKERMVLEDKELKEICDDCIRSENCKKKNTYEQARCCFNFQFIPANIEVEQVPESFADLQELCKGLKGVEIYNNSICVINIDIILFRFYDNGEIRNSGGGEIIIENRTPAQMWQIIKNLVDK